MLNGIVEVSPTSARRPSRFAEGMHSLIDRAVNARLTGSGYRFVVDDHLLCRVSPTFSRCHGLPRTGTESSVAYVAQSRLPHKRIPRSICLYLRNRNTDPSRTSDLATGSRNRSRFNAEECSETRRLVYRSESLYHLCVSREKHTRALTSCRSLLQGLAILNGAAWIYVCVRKNAAIIWWAPSAAPSPFLW